ncbi:MAG: MBL fold metallo-hydrolase [Kofleriaceae bacterium]|jgi:L-ascorbate metabolism protein UlaG (beta-lactamase superfamily)|nr:MBL fold metallo-hydrolase [Kofleriaceae bacterium]
MSSERADPAERAERADPAGQAGALARAHRHLRVRRRRSLLWHWARSLWVAPRPAQLEPLPAVGPGQLAVTFAGQATALLRYAGVGVVVDPMLGRWLGGVRRAVEPGLAPADLQDVGLILISHRHPDHLHLPTLARLPRTATVVVPSGVAQLVSPLGFARVVELAVGADLELGGVGVIASPLSHGDDPSARGLAYLVRGDGPSVFVYPDGAYFSGFADVGARYAPDLALLPIGGYWPRSFRDRHMSPLDALQAFADLRARVLVPIHHGTFATSYELLDEPMRWMRELIAERGLADHACLLRPGQSELFAAARVLRAGFDDGLAEAGAGDDDLATDAAEASAAGAEHGRAADTSWADLPVGPGSGPVAGASPAAPGPS